MTGTKQLISLATGEKTGANDLSDAETALLVGELRSRIPLLTPGHFVFLRIFDAGMRIYPHLGIVTKTTDTCITVLIANNEQISLSFSRCDGKRINADEEEDLSTALFEASVLPYSLAGNLANRFMTAASLFPRGPYSFLRENVVTNGIIGMMLEEAGEKAADIGLPNPDFLPSGEESNDYLRALAETLPGRGEPFNQSRGYTGWGPHEDYARSVDFESFTAAKSAIDDAALNVYDFYFSLSNDSLRCPYCSGSGKNRDFAELSSGFYPSGQGRWAGWGHNLTQEEVDALIDAGRLTDFTHERLNAPGPWQTRDEIRASIGLDMNLDAWINNQRIEQDGDRYRALPGTAILRTDGKKPTAAEINRASKSRNTGIRWMGHDSINTWIVTPIRAKQLQIPTEDCAVCGGNGYVAINKERLELALWLGLEGTPHYVQFQVSNICDDDLPAIKSMLNNHYQRLKERLGAVANGADLPRSDAALIEKDPTDNGWRQDMEYDNWASWFNEMNDADIDYNLIVDFAFEPIAAHDKQEHQANIAPESKLIFFLAHPRKGCVRRAYVRSVTEDDRPEITSYLEQSLAAHHRHFSWVLEHEPAQVAA